MALYNQKPTRFKMLLWLGKFQPRKVPELEQSYGAISNFGTRWRWMHITPHPLYPWKETQYEVYKRLDGPLGQSGQ
jgi:hypothetical protein